ncbi:MAG: hypothetical protein ACOX6V_01425 [Patescibacteria group bacterium]|jgi:hypothetical protein
MDEKHTLASFFTSTSAFLVGFLTLLYISQNPLTKLRCISTLVYGLFFIFLAFDEYFEIHEYLNTLIKLYLGEGNVIGDLAYVSWIFSLAVLVIIVLLLLLVNIALQQDTFTQKIKIFGIFSFCLVFVLELLGGRTYGQDIYI